MSLRVTISCDASGCRRCEPCGFAHDAPADSFTPLYTDLGWVCATAGWVELDDGTFRCPRCVRLAELARYYPESRVISVPSTVGGLTG